MSTDDVDVAMKELMEEGLAIEKTVIRDGLPVVLYKLTDRGMAAAADRIRQLAQSPDAEGVPEHAREEHVGE